ncbi:MAG: peptide chain release factor N(5)-glutamine methyltransferase [Clostridiales bacterium]|nr:peptide chain release factor N(5)-glutamine methyltransferase [Clostridiales bacterium]
MKKYLIFPSSKGIFAIMQNKQISANISNSGRILLSEFKIKSNLNNNFLLFFIRGFFYFIFGFYYTIFGILKTSQIEHSKVVNKTSKNLNIDHGDILFFVTFVLSILLSLFVLGYLPIVISFYIIPNFNIFAKRLIIALIKMAIIFGVLLIVKQFPSFAQFYRLNSACAKVQKLNYLEYFVFAFFVNTLVISLVGITTSTWYFLFANLFISLVVFSLCFELYVLMKKFKFTNKILSIFGFLIFQNASRLEIKCANIVINEIELDNNKRGNMINLTSDHVLFSEMYVECKQILENANKFEKSDLDFICCEILNKNRAEIRLLKTITRQEYKDILKAVQKRAKGEPVTKIFGKANFYGLDFVVTKDVLSPRMDTERLVETVINNCDKKSNILEIGTGSGAIAVTLAKIGGFKVTAVDISNKALEVAKKNAQNNNVKVKFLQSDLFSAVGKKKFDVIVSNPPYIPTKDVLELDDEVKNYDPILALDGGESGLDFYQRIIDQAPAYLTKNGKIFFEIGIGQAKDVKKLLQNNFKNINIVKDYNKINRVVYAQLK